MILKLIMGMSKDLVNNGYTLDDDIIYDDEGNVFYKISDFEVEGIWNDYSLSNKGTDYATIIIGYSYMVVNDLIEPISVDYYSKIDDDDGTNPANVEKEEQLRVSYKKLLDNKASVQKILDDLNDTTPGATYAKRHANEQQELKQYLMKINRLTQSLDAGTLDATKFREAAGQLSVRIENVLRTRYRSRVGSRYVRGY